MIMNKILSVTAIIAGINTLVVDGNCNSSNINSISDYSSCLSKQSNMHNSVVYKKPIISNNIISNSSKSIKTFQNNDTNIYVKKIIKNNNNIKTGIGHKIFLRNVILDTNNTNGNNKDINNSINISNISKNEQSENEYSNSIDKRINEYRKKKNEEQARYKHVIPMNNLDDQFIPIIHHNIIQKYENNIIDSNYLDNVRKVRVHEINSDDNRSRQNEQLDNINVGCYTCYEVKPIKIKEEFQVLKNGKLCSSNSELRLNNNLLLGSINRQQEQFALNNSQSNSDDMQLHNSQSNINDRQELNIQQQEQFALGGVNERNNGNANNLLNQFHNRHGEIFAGLFGLSAHNHGNNESNASDRDSRSNNRNIGSNDGYNYMQDGIMENIGKIKVGNVTIARNIDLCSIY